MRCFLRLAKDRQMISAKKEVLMKIALVGYGKMGHMIEQTAINAGHAVVTTIDAFADDAKLKIKPGDTASMIEEIKKSGAEGVIEFTHPTSVIENIKAILPTGLPLVVGTTGWNDKKDDIKKLAEQCGGTIMTTANFSIGVNVFYKIVEEASKILNNFDEYDVATWEMHHNQKADSPSGTAIEVAKHVMEGFKKKTEIVTDAFYERPKQNQLHVSSTRCGNVPGTHTVFFDCPADTIELTHTARSRQGFASGAVHALANLKTLLDGGKLTKGNLYGMSDVFPELF